MKSFITASFFLCFSVFLSTTIEAQSYKMSNEKADSLLIELSKSKSVKTNFQNEDTPDKFVLIEDSLTSEPFQADSLIPVIPKTDFQDTISIKDRTNVVTSEKKRKKANIDRNELLIEKYGVGIVMEGKENDDHKNLRSVNEASMVGVGGYKMKDQYLSPEKYGGLGFRFMNERMRLTKSFDNKISRQNIVNVDISSVINGAENANFVSAFTDYSIGYHYRFLPDPYFKILVGGSLRGMLGMVYNTRNGNNPMTIHADVDINVSLIAIYEFFIKKLPFTIRYQAESPFMGVLFSPVYDQSYYEIFSLGNTAEILNINSFHNKFAIHNYLTIDFPIGDVTIRTGYYGSYYSTNVHKIDRYIISHNFLLGLVKEFVAFGGKEMRKRNLFHSAYY